MKASIFAKVVDGKHLLFSFYICRPNEDFSSQISFCSMSFGDAIRSCTGAWRSNFVLYGGADDTTEKVIEIANFQLTQALPYSMLHLSSNIPSHNLFEPAEVPLIFIPGINLVFAIVIFGEISLTALWKV